MTKDSLPERRHKAAVIHEPRKGLLPQKSCLKRTSDSSQSSISISDDDSIPTHLISNTDEAKSSLDGYGYESSLERLIRDDADYPKDRRQEQNSDESQDLDTAQLYARSEATVGISKRKNVEIDSAEENDLSKRSKVERKLSKMEIQRIVRNKVREANRAIALEELAARTSFQQNSFQQMKSSQSQTSWLDLPN